jgi:hypothetical protein
MQGGFFMKLKLFVALLSLLFFAACTQNAPESLTEVPQESEPPIIEPEPPNLKPLELLGYRIDDDGNVLINFTGENPCPPEEYRRHFMGIWEHWSAIREEMVFLIIDDSKENNIPSWLNGGIWRTGENVIVSYSFDTVFTDVYWLDTNEPDILYSAAVLHAGNNELHVTNINETVSINLGVDIFNKTNLPVNEPQDGFISTLRLMEISQDYGFEYSLFYGMEYISGDYHFSDIYFISPHIYLISEAPDKLVFETILIDIFTVRAHIDITLTIEKIDDEWVRTFETHP